jgi:hypothetical protein
VLGFTLSHSRDAPAGDPRGGLVRRHQRIRFRCSVSHFRTTGRDEKGLAHMAILLHPIGAVAANRGGGGVRWCRVGGRNSSVRWRQADRWIRIEEDRAEVARRRPRCRVVSRGRCTRPRRRRRMRPRLRRREEEAAVLRSCEGVARGGGGGVAREGVGATRQTIRSHLPAHSNWSCGIAR